MITLANFNNSNDYDRSSSLLKYILWVAISCIFSSQVPGSSWRVSLLRIFGAEVDSSLVIKPGVKIKLPWKLIIGSDCWIGECVWIDNTEDVKIGNDVCISQGTFICTGSHNFKSDSFNYSGKAITIADHVWVCAKCIILAGVTIGRGSMIAAGEVVRGAVPARTLMINGNCDKI